MEENVKLCVGSASEIQPEVSWFVRSKARTDINALSTSLE